MLLGPLPFSCLGSDIMDTSQTQLVVKDIWNTCVPAGPHPLRHRDELLTYRAGHSVVKARSSLVHRMNEPASRGAVSRLRMWSFAGLSTGRRPGAGHPGLRVRSTACLRAHAMHAISVGARAASSQWAGVDHHAGPRRPGRGLRVQTAKRSYRWRELPTSVSSSGASLPTLFTDGEVSRDVSATRIFCGETDLVEWLH
jgi:hypothetical protein